ncbi:DUF3251 domain-containing protein [Stenotrophomonas sp. PS02289]|uniref:DUF3251 domain-containing protein n=1 Tax=Stenotrophomonas sp. PS02289 TaxID=2991422 RepID=UPI00249B69D0|nr:DUF3251 domain-containing protein [Stenotrophomonas sp. PS02289]
MKKSYQNWVLSTLSYSLLGCSNAVSDAKVVEARLSEMEKRTSALEAQSRSFDTRLTTYIQLQGDRKAYLDPSGNAGYGAVQTDVGILLVSVSEVAPKADGTEIVLEIGNPTTATYVGAEAQINYNVRFDGTPEWQDKLRTTKTKIQAPLRPASWNTFKTSLPGIKPDQLGHLAVNIVPDEVRLNRSID